ncbi:HTTM domain-containing protein [Flavobacterium lipolyticum]|uniref:HTTM domain-containing protein n=1 Tax=Flavobacterium lipolyticum TaxID=2893754 RepID=A0ABS8LXP9_9FLAO|nr:HTTM domain-containing protein [Flavobacterium sp. F-126]MCC9017354.1 HTTM domain-containing protein [Flavobacterium sp. F-126]
MNEHLFNRKIGITIFRTVMGVLILKDFMSFYFNRRFLFSDEGIVSYELYLDIINYYNIDWLYIDFNKSVIIKVFCFSGIILSTSFMLGILTRISAILLFFLLFIFKIRAIYLLDGSDNVISVMIPFFIFIDSYSLIDSYERFSLNIKNKVQPYLNIASHYFVIAMMLQVCIIYFFASMHKLQGEYWREGSALYYILNNDDFSASFLNKILTESTLLIKFMTWFAIAFQFSFSFLVLFKKTKMKILLLGVLFHTGIFILMRIDNFSIMMLACYSIFLTDNEYAKLFKKVIPIKHAN